MNKLAFVLILITLGFLNTAKAQDNVKKKGIQEVQIKTSAQCDMCKMRIEEALAYTKGVKKSELNVDTKIATIFYNPKKTDIQKLRDVIVKVGYDADEITADQKAYDELPACCKKGGHDKEH